MTNGSCYAGTLQNSNVMYFKVAAPVFGIIATNHLTTNNGSTGNLILSMEQYGIPTLSAPPDDYESRPGTDLSLIMTPITTPPLLRGQTYYLAVRNANPLETNDFNLCINFNINSNYWDDITPLTNAIQVCMTNLPADNLARYYSFIASSNAYEVTFTVTPSNGDVDMVVNYGLPLPTPTTNFAISATPGPVPEVITVTDYSLSQVPGIWYIGVYNMDTGPVNYCIEVTEKLLEIIPLTNNIPYANIASNSPNMQFYRYTVTNTAFEVRFRILPILTNDLDLYANYGLPLAMPTNYLAASVNLGTNAEKITLVRGGTFYPTPGDWYLTVANPTPGVVAYRVVVEEVYDIDITHPGDGDPWDDTVGGAGMAGFAQPAKLQAAAAAAIPGLNVKYYAFDVASNAVQVNFELYNLSGNVDLFVRTNVPLPDIDNYHYASTNAGTTNELIMACSNLVAGTWYVAVVNQETNDVNYTGRITQIFDTNITQLVNGVTVTNTAPTFTPPPSLKNFNYYSFTVSSNAVQASVAVFGLTNNADLYVSQGLPLPNQLVHHYASTNLGTTNEYVVVATNSTPVQLTPGTWYAGVLTPEMDPATYRIEFREVLASDIQPLGGCVEVTNTIPAHAYSYYVLPVSENALEAVFELLKDATPLGVYVGLELPLPLATNALYTMAGDVVYTNLFILHNSETNPLVPGNWFVTIANTNDTEVFYTLRGTELVAGVNPLLLTEREFLTNAINPMTTSNVVCETQYYQFSVPDGAAWAYFEFRPLAAETQPNAISTNLGFHLKNELPIGLSWDYVNFQVPTNGAFWLVTSNSPVPLLPGEWYMGVNNGPLGSPTTYRVRAVTATEALVDLTNRVPYLAGITNSPGAFYRFRVATNALQVNFRNSAEPERERGSICGQRPGDIRPEPQLGLREHERGDQPRDHQRGVGNAARSAGAGRLVCGSQARSRGDRSGVHGDGERVYPGQQRGCVDQRGRHHVRPTRRPQATSITTRSK